MNQIESVSYSHCPQCGAALVSTGHVCDYGWTEERNTSANPYKCPVCDGTGLVSRPPGVAGDQASWASNDTGPYQCRACGGAGIIWAGTQNEKLAP